MPQLQLRVYPRYTVVAEALEAMVKLGTLNSRMTDYFDLWVLARHSVFHGAVLATAIKDQQMNFAQGADVLMRVLEAHCAY